MQAEHGEDKRALLKRAYLNFGRKVHVFGGNSMVYVFRTDIYTFSR